MVNVGGEGVLITNQRTNVTEKWLFYNVISVGNLNETKHNVILISSKKRNYIEQINNVIVTYWKKASQWRTKKKRNY